MNFKKNNINLNFSKLDITAIILTYNEKIHINRCLNFIKGFVKEIIVIDNYSNDNTAKICKKHNVRVYKHKLISQGQQINWALENINVKSKWIFRIDADEIVPKKSFTQINNIIMNNKNISGIRIKRKIKFFNKIMELHHHIIH